MQHLGMTFYAKWFLLRTNFRSTFSFYSPLYSFPFAHTERNRLVADRKNTLLTNILHKESCTELDLRGVDVYLRVHLTVMVCA